MSALQFTWWTVTSTSAAPHPLPTSAENLALGASPAAQMPTSTAGALARPSYLLACAGEIARVDQASLRLCLFFPHVCMHNARAPLSGN